MDVIGEPLPDAASEKEYVCKKTTRLSNKKVCIKKTKREGRMVCRFPSPPRGVTRIDQADYSHTRYSLLLCLRGCLPRTLASLAIGPFLFSRLARLHRTNVALPRLPRERVKNQKNDASIMEQENKSNP